MIKDDIETNARFADKKDCSICPAGKFFSKESYTFI